MSAQLCSPCYLMIGRQLRQLLKNCPSAALTQPPVVRQHSISSEVKVVARKRRTISAEVRDLLATPSDANAEVRRPHLKRIKVLDSRQAARPEQVSGASSSGLARSG